MKKKIKKKLVGILWHEKGIQLVKEKVSDMPERCKLKRLEGKRCNLVRAQPWSLVI